MDVVVDETADVAWRLRALGGLKHTQDRRVLCLGGAAGWGSGGRRAPQLARERFGLDLVEVSYDELGRRLQAARADARLVQQASAEAGDYLGRKGVTLETRREFVANAFLLTHVLRGMMRESGATVITINHCISTIMPICETTACLPLSRLKKPGLSRVLRVRFCRHSIGNSLAGGLTPASIPERSHHASSWTCDAGSLHGAHENGRKEPGTRQDRHPFRKRLWRGAQSRNAHRAENHEYDSGFQL
jgi:hypothetical protein